MKRSIGYNVECEIRYGKQLDIYKSVRKGEMLTMPRSNPKKFWQFVNRKTKTAVGIVDLEMSGTNELTKDDAQKSEELAIFFSNVFTNENLDKMPSIDEIELDNKLEFFTIEAEDVRKKLDNLNQSKSPGPDNIHPRLLKEMSSVIQRPLTILYQNTLKSGEISEEWKSHSNIQKGREKKTK